MSSSSSILLLLLPCMALGAVVQHDRNFIQAPANCQPPFALINGRCVFVVQGCSENSGTPCQKTDYPSKSVIPRETEDAIMDGDNNDQLDERSFVGTIDCKDGYRLFGKRCRKIFKRVENRTGEGRMQQLDGDINDADSHIEDIYNTQPKMDPTETEFAQRNIILSKCRYGYRPDIKGRCRKIFNPALDEPNSQSASTRRFLFPCRPGYLPDRNGICREVFNPESSNTQNEQSFSRGIIAVATSGCKSGYRLDSKGRCRKIYTPVSGYSLNDDSREAEFTKAFIQVPGCNAGAVLINGVCRPVYTDKRNSEDYMNTNENTLLETNLRRRRRRSLRNQKHQGYLYSGSEE